MSAPLVLTRVKVKGQELDASNKPVVGKAVSAQLSNVSVSTGTVAEVGTQPIYTETDTNGYWELLLVPNVLLNPAGTQYTVLTPTRSLTVIVPNDGLDHEVSSIVTSQPAPAGNTPLSNLNGPIRIAGAFTVDGKWSLGGGPWYDPTHPAFGAKFDGVLGVGTNDSAAILLWLQTILNTGIGIVPKGNCIINSTVTLDCANGSLTIFGLGKSGVSVFMAGAALNGIMFDLPNLRNAVLENFGGNGLGLSTTLIRSIMGATGPPPTPPSGETSTGLRFYNLTATNFASWGFDIEGHEDGEMFGVHVNAGSSPGNPGLRWSAPNGCFAFFGCTFIGRLWLAFQLASIHGCTCGPVSVANPNSLITISLAIFGGYLYDSIGHYCLEASDRFTDIACVGVFLINSNNDTWVRGQIIAGVCLYFGGGSGFLTSGPNNVGGGQATVYLVTADGAGLGLVVLDGMSATASGIQTTRKAFRTLNGSTAIMVNRNSIGSNFIPPDRNLVAGGTAWPAATNVGFKNPYPVAVQVTANLAGTTSSGGGLSTSPDNSAWTPMGIPIAAFGTGAMFSFILGPDEYAKYEFSAGAPKYGVRIAA